MSVAKIVICSLGTALLLTPACTRLGFDTPSPSQDSLRADTFKDGSSDAHSKDGSSDAHSKDGSSDAASCSPTGWWDAHWQTRQRATLSYSGKAVLRDFPILVTLDLSAYDPASLGTKGSQIRFVDQDGLLLPYEIELWDSSHGKAAIWVRLNALSPQTRRLWLYLDNKAATAMPSGNSVWDADFVGVWHMAAKAPLGLDAFPDATPNAKHATPHGLTASALVDGKIGHAVHFDTPGSHLSIPAKGQDVLSPRSGLSLEAWVFDEGPSNQITNTIVGRQLGGQWEDAYTLFLEHSARDPKLSVNGESISGQAAVAEGTWTHLAATVSPSALKIYINGQLNRTKFVSTTLVYDENDVTIGGEENGATPGQTNESFYGIIDEVRISKIPRSAEWIAAQFASMTGRLLTWGAIERCH